MTDDEDRIDFTMLADWIEGRLDASDAARVVAAVDAGDERVLAGIAWLRGFIAQAKTLPLHEPPPIVGQRLRQHFERWREARQSLTEPVTEIAATLIFDSRKDLASAGVRGAGTADDSVHLAFTCTAADVVLDVRRTSKGDLNLAGQVLPIEPAAAPVFQASARTDGPAIVAMDGDELGRFQVDGVPDAAVELRLSNGQIELVTRFDLRDDA